MSNINNHNKHRIKQSNAEEWVRILILDILHSSYILKLRLHLQQFVITSADSSDKYWEARSLRGQLISLIQVVTKDSNKSNGHTDTSLGQLRATNGNIGLKIKYFYHKLNSRKLPNITSSNCR